MLGQARRADLAQLCAMCATIWSGSMFLWMTPFLFPALGEVFGSTTMQTASLMSAMLAAGGVAVLVAGSLMPNARIAVVSIVGSVTEVAGLAWLARGGDPLVAFLPASIAGFGSGLVMAMVPRIAARTPSPERAYGITGVTNTLIATAFFAVIPSMRLHWGAASILYLHLAAAAVLLPVILIGLPYLSATTVRSATRADEKATAGFAVVLMIAGQLLYSVSMGSYWAYIEPAAAAAGVAPQETGWLVAVATLLSLVGPALAVWISKRANRTIPLAIGRTLFGLAGAGSLIAQGPVSYFGLILLASAMITYIPAFEGGVLIRLDPSARAANASAATGFLLNGAGPIVGGLLMTRYGMAGLAAGVVAISTLAAIVQIMPSLIVDRAVDASAETREPEIDFAANALSIP